MESCNTNTPTGEYGQIGPVSPVSGRPLSEASKRFFDLRDSGYTGQIDQDGYAGHYEGRRWVRD